MAFWVGVMALFCEVSFAQALGQHAMHNMVVFGVEEIFASHIVYKVPHNFQVILKLDLSDEVRRVYLAEKKKFPEQQFILLLKHMDIKEISKADFISGTLLREDVDGRRVELVPLVELRRDQFKIIFFDELPISLSALNGRKIFAYTNSAKYLLLNEQVTIAGQT